MSPDPNDKPALREPEAREIELEVIDDGDSTAGARGGPMADFAQQVRMAPDMIVQAFRTMLKERLKRWLFRSLLWGGVLGFFATEHTWAKWAFGIWAFIAFLHLAFLLYGWYASGKQGAKLARIFGGMVQPPGQH